MSPATSMNGGARSSVLLSSPWSQVGPGADWGLTRVSYELWRALAASSRSAPNSMILHRSPRPVVSRSKTRYSTRRPATWPRLTLAEPLDRATHRTVRRPCDGKAEARRGRVNLAGVHLTGRGGRRGRSPVPGWNAEGRGHWRCPPGGTFGLGRPWPVHGPSTPRQRLLALDRRLFDRAVATSSIEHSLRAAQPLARTQHGPGSLHQPVQARSDLLG